LCDHPNTTAGRARCRRRGGGYRVKVREQTDWQGTVLPRAAEIVGSYHTGVSLRQLFYLLVSEQLIPNSEAAYAGLGRTSAVWRDEDRFPDLIDTGRDIHGHSGPAEPAVMDLRKELEPELFMPSLALYRPDNEAQPYNVYLGIEKDTQVRQLESWFPSYPIVPLRGQASQPFRKAVREAVERDGRPAVLLYAGDFDASGWRIPRTFYRKTGGKDTWHSAKRIALEPQQIEEYGLPENPGKEKDPNQAAFMRHYGLDEAIQVELEALRPEDLRAIFQRRIAEWWDEEAAAAVEERERADQERFDVVADRVRPLIADLRRQIDEWDWEELLR